MNRGNDKYFKIVDVLKKLINQVLIFYTSIIIKIGMKV